MPPGSNQTITYSGNSFTITGESGGSPGNGVPASYPSIYIGNNGDTQNKNDPPRGRTRPSRATTCPSRSARSARLTSTAAYNRASGDYNAAYDIWVASGSADVGLQRRAERLRHGLDVQAGQPESDRPA